MTWEEFNDEVRVHLLAHNRRQGVQDYIDALIKAGVVDLQRVVDRYRIGHHEIYAPGDLTDDGFASRGDAPAGRVNRAWLTLYDVDTAEDDYCNYRDLELAPYSVVQQFQCGETRRAEYWIAFDPAYSRFWVAPKVEETMKLHIEWDGTKTDWADSDEVVFNEKDAECVSHYVRYNLAVTVDKDAEMSRFHFNLFRTQKAGLFSDYRSMQRLNHPPAS